MRNQNLDYFKKGNFLPIRSEFIDDGIDAVQKLAQLQEKYQMQDTDTVLNELHDAIVGQYLGFALVNRSKHGMDCKLSAAEDVFLESKVASWSPSGVSATFNDTTAEKAEVFKDEKVWLALSVWSSASELLFICYGQNEKIGEFLEKKVEEQTAQSKRRTQTISISSLISDYGFKILAVAKSKEELYMKLTATRIKAFKNMDRDIIIDLSEFHPPYIEDDDVRLAKCFNFLKENPLNAMIGFTAEQVTEIISHRVQNNCQTCLDDYCQMMLSSAIKKLQEYFLHTPSLFASSTPPDVINNLNQNLNSLLIAPFDRILQIEEICDYLETISTTIDSLILSWNDKK